MLEQCDRILFVLLLKFGAVLSIICGYEWLFDGGFILEEYTAVYCYPVVFSEVSKYIPAIELDNLTILIFTLEFLLSFHLLFLSYCVMGSTPSTPPPPETP